MSPSNLLLRFFLYCLWGAVVALLVTAEAYQQGTSALYGEHSLVEYLQTTFLVLVALLFGAAARASAEWRGWCTVLMFVAVTAAVREQDSFFDHNVFDGFWQLLALAILVAMGGYWWRYPGSVVREAGEFMRSRPAGFLAAGFVTVFVYSRLIGMQAVWRSMLGDDYRRVVKNFFEETTELFGYSLLVVAAIETLLVVRARLREAGIRSTGAP